MSFLKKYAASLLMLALFVTVGITLWLTLDDLFYLFNFSYIGCSIAFGLSLVFVSVLFLMDVEHKEQIIYWSFLAGNALYYGTGIVLALVLKDNRAFCKYICPVTVFLRPASYFSLLRVKVDKTNCISCGTCKRVCPMNVDVCDAHRSRKNGTECILCLECVQACPKQAIRF